MDYAATPLDAEPTTNAYEDTVEGKLQYHADLSLYYGSMIKEAATSFKKQYYQKKLEKNNNKMYQLLVRTPNTYNPLLQMIQNGTNVTPEQLQEIQDELLEEAQATDPDRVAKAIEAANPRSRVEQ